MVDRERPRAPPGATWRWLGETLSAGSRRDRRRPGGLGVARAQSTVGDHTRALRKRSSERSGRRVHSTDSWRWRKVASSVQPVWPAPNWPARKRRRRSPKCAACVHYGSLAVGRAGRTGRPVGRSRCKSPSGGHSRCQLALPARRATSRRRRPSDQFAHSIVHEFHSLRLRAAVLAAHSDSFARHTRRHSRVRCSSARE